jgi:hypothetical protein
MISAVPQPSAVARMMLARHTCFCGALRPETIASSRWRISIPRDQRGVYKIKIEPNGADHDQHRGCY